MTTRISMEIVELEGTLISLTGIRKIHGDAREIQVSQAIFLVSTSSGLKRCIMFLWDSDATRIRELVIGTRYKFKVATREQGSEIIAFFLPNSTFFKLLKSEGTGY